MKRTICDWCKTEVADGPVGAYFNVEIQPSYDVTEDKWELCPDCVAAIRALHRSRYRKYIEGK